MQRKTVFSRSKLIEGLESVTQALDSTFPWERRHIEADGNAVRLRMRRGKIGGIRLVYSERYFRGWSKADHVPGVAEEPLAVVGFNLLRGMMLEPPSGGFISTVAGQTLISPYRPGGLVRRDFGSAMLFLSFPRQLVGEIVARHFHVSAAKPTVDLQILPGGHPIAALKRLTENAVADIEALPDGTTATASGVLERTYQDTLTTLLLLNLPHSLSDTLRRAGQGGGSRHVARALDFIRAHLQEPVSLDAIASAAHCSPRQLQLAFRKQLDMTPMAMLRKLRLELADERLRSGYYRNVTEAALSLGFSHTGRFAADFQAQFGYLPRQALGSRTR